MRDINYQISKIRNLINSILASVKRRDVFSSVRVELESIYTLPHLDVETRCSSTFQINEICLSCPSSL